MAGSCALAVGSWTDGRGNQDRWLFHSVVRVHASSTRLVRSSDRSLLFEGNILGTYLMLISGQCHFRNIAFGAATRTEGSPHRKLGRSGCDHGYISRSAAQANRSFHNGESVIVRPASFRRAQVAESGITTAR